MVGSAVTVHGRPMMRYAVRLSSILGVTRIHAFTDIPCLSFPQ
jgi:hypothetical protein